MADLKYVGDDLVTVFGGSGFLGRHIVRALARRGWRVRVAVRRPDLAFHLQPLGTVGQINAVQANLRYPDSIAPALKGARFAINLVGVLAERGRQNFEAVHAFGARAIARAAEAEGVALIHFSAIGADAQSPSSYARSKARGEAAVREAQPGAIVMRPSVVFGPEDEFFNRFALLAKYLPVLPLFGGGATKMQPVFVGDIAEAVTHALDGAARPGEAYELGGPEVMTLRHIMEFACLTAGRRRPFASLPFPAATLLAGGTEIAGALTLGLFPKALVTTRDQIELLKLDNVVSAEAIAQKRTLVGLGVAPQAVEAIVPSYLYRFRKTGQFAQGSVS